MKKFLALVLALALTLSFAATGCSKSGSTSKGVVNVCNWGEYIDESIFDDFTAKTGIKVNYKTVETNEELYAVLKAGGAEYDVIFPSDYMVSRLANEGMLEPIDFKNVPNMSNMDPAYLKQEFDPDNTYSVPYMWGTVGIIYNTKMVTKEVASWDILWDPDYAGQILMFDNSRDAMAIALFYLGYSVNTTSEAELNEAYALLENQKPLLQAYVMDQIFDKMESGEAAVAPYYAGDYLTMAENNPDLAFCLPEEGANIFIDSMCIPKGAENKANAEAFINFMCETEVCLANCDYIGYSTPSAAAYAELSDDVKNDGVSYPDAETLARCHIFTTLPQETLNLYDALWIKLKS